MVRLNDLSSEDLPNLTDARENVGGELSCFSLREMEKNLIFKALKKTNGNRTYAAKVLGISIRTLRNKLNEYKENLSLSGAL
jgi:two-component system response regulator FlrC